MKLVADLKSIKNISRYQVDGLVFASTDFSCGNDGIFSYSEIKKIVEYCHNNKLISILNIDRIIEEDELSFLSTSLELFLELGIDYYLFSDFAIFEYFQKKREEKRLIYDPKTLITNFEDALYYKEIGIQVAISNELTLQEISSIIQAENTAFELYGHHQMFYSKRALLSSFSELLGNVHKFSDQLLSISEEKRDELHLLYESKHGTFIYTAYRYALFLELPMLVDKLKFGRINTAFIEEEEALAIISLYKAALDKNSDMKALYQELLKINANIGRGFLDKKSILLKEEAE
ncbi:MAG: U32 family peptidase [Bacilli bacterium]|nr:U32 family peptidase [Bacilli bacterium]